MVRAGPTASAVGAAAASPHSPATLAPWWRPPGHTTGQVAGLVRAGRLARTVPRGQEARPWPRPRGPASPASRVVGVLAWPAVPAAQRPCRPRRQHGWAQRRLRARQPGGCRRPATAGRPRCQASGTGPQPGASRGCCHSSSTGRLGQPGLRPWRGWAAGYCCCGSTERLGAGPSPGHGGQALATEAGLEAAAGRHRATPRHAPGTRMGLAQPGCPGLRPGCRG